MKTQNDSRMGDFAVRIEGDRRGGLRVLVLRSPAGLEVSEPFTPPLPLRGSARAGGQPHRNVELEPEQPARGDMAESYDPKRIGERLFAALFRGDVRRAWDRSRPVAGADRVGGVRLRLSFDLANPKAAAVAALPWELLCDPKLAHSFLARQLETPILRFVAGGKARRLEPLRPPLRVLLVSANPRGSARLELDEEAKRLQRELGNLGRVEVGSLEVATWKGLRKRLREGWHVLHFMGHGTFDETSGRGQLLFEDESGNAEPVPGQALADLLEEHPGLRLVVLNACESARADRFGATPFEGVAQALVAAGVPAVVAMREPIADATALRFSSAFYRALGEGRSVDAAMVAGRKAIARAEPETFAWAIPMLCLSVDDCDVLRLEEALPSPWPRRIWTGLATAGSLAAGMILYSLMHQPVTKAEPYVRPVVPAEPRCPALAGLDMPFVYVAPGQLTMGSDRGESYERPAHLRTIEKPFCLAAFELTRKQWRIVIDGNDPGSLAPGDDLPQGKVSFEEAERFIAKLRRRTGNHRVRLPSEAEWEHVARAGSTGPYGFGDAAEGLVRHGNCDSGDRFDNLSAPVGSFEPNAFGLYDLHGNVWEWVSDRPALYPGADGPALLPDSANHRIRRGGSWRSSEETCRAFTRSFVKPARRYEDTGLRLAMDLP